MSDQTSPERTTDMAGRHGDTTTDLVKASPFIPGLREDPEAELDFIADDDLSPEEILAEPPDARDIAAELAAPPRRKLPWLTLALCGGVIAALSFAGGALVEKNNAPATGGARNAAAGGFAGFTRGGTAGAGAGTGTGTGTGRTGGTAGGGATIGTVKLVDGSTVYLTDTSGNVVKVTTGKSTTVSVTKNGKLSDLQPGQTVTVRGSTDSSGDLAATTVTEGGSPFGAGGGFGG